MNISESLMEKELIRCKEELCSINKELESIQIKYKNINEELVKSLNREKKLLDNLKKNKITNTKNSRIKNKFNIKHRALLDLIRDKI